MKLLDFINGEIIVRDEIYAIACFKKLYDSRKDKNLLTKELTYIWFYEDYFSDFSTIIDETERTEKICKSIEMPKGWKEDNLLKTCREFYRENGHTIIVKLAMGTMSAANRMANFLKDCPIENANDFKKIADSVKVSNDNIKILEEIEESIRSKSKDDSKKVKGGQTKNDFEDMDNE